ncbi:MAG: helix-turn-helix transcriptional regulator [Clostridia bacterium]|nr:helix-turn-helix transcriptional regulator [Clostridia bacterium]
MLVDYKNVGIRIAQRRMELRIKQGELAKMTGMSKNHICNIENRHSVPSLETLVKICEALQVTPDYLLLGKTRMKSIPQSIKNDLLLCNQHSLDVISQLIDIMISDQDTSK